MFVRARATLCCLASAIALLAAACSKTEGEVCLNDRSCGSGRRCEEQTKGEPKICVECPKDEILYDGIDNDCNSRTRDADFDEDGDNASDATVRPGTDCDDMDPTINVRAMEICGDLKDNNCNAKVDEPQCGDRLPPSVTITRPMPVQGSLYAGTIDVHVETNDDTSVVEIRLFVDGNEVDSIAMENAIFSLDTTAYNDGPITLRAEALDLADRTARDEITIELDNRTAPTLSVARPSAGLSYRGTLTLEATANDAAGIKEVSLDIDGLSAGPTATVGPYIWQIDTDGLPEGTHNANFRALDNNNNEGTATLSFNVDRTGPNLDIEVTPITGIQVSGVFTVNVVATDPAGIENILGEAGPESATSRTSPLRITVDSLAAPRIPNGPLVITATASDGTIVDDDVSSLGNTSTASVTVVVENIPPEPIVTLVEPQQDWGVFRLTDIRATVTSPVGNAISRVEFFVNGVSVFTDTMSPYQTQFDFTDFSGTATVTVEAEDSAQYITQASAVVRIVLPPTFRISDFGRPVGTLGTNGYAIGDVNEDGTLDAVLAGTDLSVLTGSIAAGGNFHFDRARRIGGNAIRVKMANLDIDPALDLIVQTAGGFDIHINQGSGSGLFNPPTTVTTGPLVVSDIEIADLDNDNQVDIVMGLNSGGGGDVRVYRQMNGVFTTGVTYGTVGTVSDVELADVELDGDIDIALSRSGSSVASVYRNNGTGGFGAAQDSFAGAQTQQVRVEDVTADGYPDLVVIAQGIGVEVLEGSPFTPGTFTFVNEIVRPTPPNGLAFGDLDGDLDRDLIVTRGNAFEALLSDGNGVFTFHRAFVISRDPARPSLYDLNQDGFPEVIVQTATDNGIAFARSLGAADYLAAPQLIDLPQNIEALATGDVLGGDNRLDLVVLSSPSGPGTVSQVTMLQNVAGSTTGFVNAAAINLPDHINQPRSINVGDIDGQFGLDFVFGSFNSPTMTDPETAGYFLSDGAGGFGAPNYLSLERPASCMIGDVDDDGLGEVVCTQDFTMAGLNDGSVVFGALGLAPVHSINRGFGATSVAIGDLSNDGGSVLDYAVANSGTNDVTVNLWTGTGYATATFNALAGISGITIGTVGEDDINDIVGVSNGGVIIMEGDASFGFGTPVLWPAGTTPLGVVGGDFNDDGLYDVMVMNPSTDTISLLIASPQGGFFRPVAVGVVESPGSFVVGDFDLDGRSDIGVGSSSSPALVVIYNNRESL